MKKVILLGLLFAVCVTGCSKKEEPKAEPDVYKRQEMGRSILFLLNVSKELARILF